MTIVSAAVRLGATELARLLGQPEPTPEQAAVIAAPLSPGVVVAGAGSGKSETMAARVVWLVANGHVRPEQVLGLTFTRKASAELSERVRRRLATLKEVGLLKEVEDLPPDLLDGEPTVSTYHAYAARLVRDHALREAVEPTLRLITPAVEWQLAARVVSAYDGPMDRIAWTPGTVISAVRELGGELSEHLRAAGEVVAVGDRLRAWRDELPGKEVNAELKKMINTQEAREQLLPMVEAYAASKARLEVMDHGDQVALAARLAQRHPEVGAIERSRYAVVLLDEYQDTSHAQLVLLRELFSTGADGEGHPVTAVGDPCQSIYGWRGASSGNLRRFVTDFPARPGEPATLGWLSTSFRNGERVLDVAAVLSQPLRAEAPDLPLLTSGPARRGRGRIEAGLFTTTRQEAEWIAARVHAALSAPAGIAPDGLPWPAGERGEEEPLRFSDVAVLCRKRSQFGPIRRALEERSIPVEVVGLGGLLTVPEVQDIVATLRVVHDPGAGDALARLLTGPRWRLGPRDLVALGRRARELVRAAGRDVAADVSVVTPEQADPLRQAVADMTAELGSLVDALDDLGPAEAYSPEGYRRLSLLAAELRTLRRHISQPLPDLVTEVERTLGLDIEVAARPGMPAMAARADLDALVDAAARFAGNEEDPTLAAFLAYLSAAEDEEFGLEAGRVGETDSVKLMTVHASKGLQWPLVVVPGLAQGRSAQVFPARPKESTQWLGNPRKLPFPLRGDAADLPRLSGLSKDERAAFLEACKARDEREERRLAYVAVTRASFGLLCSGFWWGEGASKLGPSAFLEEVRGACERGAGVLAHWAEEPEEDRNPALAQPHSLGWPVRPQGPAYDAALAGASLVGSAAEAGDWLERLARYGKPAWMERRLGGWERDVELLLAERGRAGDSSVDVELPGRLSVSALVTLARDPSALARQVRRPMPRPPAPFARRGTAFHRWLETHYGQQRLLDPDAMPGAADDGAIDDDLDELRARFEKSEWAARVPLDVEVPFETLVAGRLVRGRMDAVFADPDGGFTVVDWKTGSPPAGPREERAVAVQLAAYRLAWAALRQVPVDRVRAAFHYVRAETTVRPADLLDADGLAALIETLPEAIP
ncbi:MAG: AAA family ATPase [Streptosporangiales bacterium]|nr:AAA family ATPase [Streptosporangiales bacterium]